MRRATIPILQNLLLTVQDGALRVTGTDLDLAAATGLPAEIARAGAVTVPAAILREIVQTLPAGEIRLLHDPAKARLTLTAGRARFQLATLPAGDFPDLKAGEMPHRFALPVHDVLRLAGELAFAISTEETRYYLNGVYVHAPDTAERHEGLRAVATDGRKLARLCLPRPEGAEGMPGVILPRKLVAELGRIAAADGEAAFAVALSSRVVRVTRGDIVVTSKRVDGTYSDYQRVIPTANATRVTAARAELAAALDRVRAVARGACAVRLAAEPGRLTLSQRSDETDEGTDEVDAALTGDPVTIGFNGSYLSEILAVLGGDTIALDLASAGDPAILTRTGDSALLVVLMPMRVTP